MTATDARGASSTESIGITVHGLDSCFTGRSDGFEGTALDTQRWDSVVRGNADMTVADGALRIPLTATDLYQGTNTAPNIVLQHLLLGMNAHINIDLPLAALDIVRLPDRFQAGLLGRKAKKPVSAWAAMGVTRIDGRPLQGDYAAGIIAPEFVYRSQDQSNSV